MDAQSLKSLVTPAGGTLSLNLDALGSTSLTEMFEPFLSGKTLVINGVTERTESADTVAVTGTGGNQIFKEMKVTAVFSLGRDGLPAVLITAEGQAGWTFDKSFPLLRRSIFSGLGFEPAPKLFLSSAEIQGHPAGMTFAGTLKPGSPLGALALLTGGAEQQLTGDVHVIEGAPLIVLFGPVNASVDLTIFKLRNVRYELYSEPNYNAASFEWEANAYIGFSVDLVFTAQNKKHTITLLADIYDPRTSILFVTNLTEGLDAAMDELSAFLGGIGLGVDVGDLRITNNVKLSDLKVLVNPSGPNLIEYITLGVETTVNLTLVPDLLELDAIDVSFRIDSPLNSPQLSGVVSGLIGIGETGTLELSAFFGEFAFGGGLRREDPLYIKQVFEHFMKTSNSDLPDLKLTHFDFHVRPSPLSYSAEIDLEAGDWAVHVGTTALSIQDLKFSMNRPGPEADTRLSVVGVFGIGDFHTVVKADYAGAAEGWTFEGGTLGGQAVPIGRFVQDLAHIFKVDAKLPAPIADLTINDLKVRFNTLRKNFTFTCGAAFPVGGKTVAIAVTIDLKNDNGTYTKTFGGSLTIGSAGDTLGFDLYFSQDTTQTHFLAAYAHEGDAGKLNLKKFVGYASEEAAGYIPPSLEIDLKDVLFAVNKDSTGTKVLFGMDVGTAISLTDLPLIGQKFPPQLKVGVDDLQILIASESLDEGEVRGLNTLIGLMPHPITRLPSPPPAANTQTVIRKGFTVSAAMNFGGSPQILSLPVTSTGGPQSAQAAEVAPTSPAAAPVTSSDNAKWFTLQKTFGPVYFEKVGVSYQDAAIWFLLNASLSVGGLKLSLDGLAVGSPVKAFHPKFDLRGLGLDYKSGGVEVGGAFLRVPKEQSGKSYDQYNGAAIIKSGQLALSALGSYAELDGHPSLFVYAVLDYPLGGPSFFFVTGLAAGFGYNRALLVPPVEQVAQFPLVADAVSGAAMPNDLGQKLDDLQRYVPPSAGDYFLAVGIKFTSFKLVDSFALLTVSFGTQFEINLLGLSTLIVPTPIPGQPVTPLAEVQMTLRATFNPARGFLGVSAQLTPASFILSRDCHLTGGFAFYSWFSGEHKGDFVLTLGGYHPDYKVPAHYPSVPRVGFNWRVDERLSLKGGAYYALTASALMAGCSLQATWDSGNLKAHFNAGADFIIYWQPYHYDARVTVDIGVSYTYNFFGTHTLSVDVGADLHIWGPEFAGTAHIKLSIISFDISFGSGSRKELQPIGWNAFRDSFLPADKNGQLAICAISVAGGLVNAPRDVPGVDWVINPKSFALVTNSVIPSKAAFKRDNPITVAGNETKFGIGSMAVASGNFTSSHTITIGRRRERGDAETYEPVEADFEFTPVLKNVPVGLWGETLTPAINGPAFVRETLAGFEVKPAARRAPCVTADVARSALQYEAESVPNVYAWGVFAPFVAGNLDEAARRSAVAVGITAVATAAERARLLGALGVVADINLGGYDDRAFLIAPQIEALVR